MGLMITFPVKDGDRWTNRTVEWHYSEPLPNLQGIRVATFQASGDELDLLLDALRKTRPPEPITIEGTPV